MLSVLYFDVVASRIRNIMILWISSLYLCRNFPQDNYKRQSVMFSAHKPLTNASKMEALSLLNY